MSVLLWLTAIGGVQQIEQATGRKFSQRFKASKPRIKISSQLDITQ